MGDSAETDPHITSEMRLITSENLTIEMAVIYLYEWRNNLDLVQALLERIIQFDHGKAIHFIPTMM